MSSIWLTVGLLGIFVGFALLFASVGALGNGERRGTSRSLEAIEALNSAPASMRRDLDVPFASRVLVPVLGGLSNLGRRLTPTERQAKLRARLDAAGNFVGWDVDRIIAFKALGLIVGVVLGLLVWLASSLTVAASVLILGSLAALGWYLPEFVLARKTSIRSERIRRELPDALDLLTISVEAGLAFDSATKQVATRTDGPVADEFARLLAEMQVGRSRTEAIRALGERSDVDEVKSFAGAMVQADKFGVPIADVLRVQSKELRVKRRQKAEEAAQKVPVKLLFPLIFFILPCIFIIVIGPAVLNVIDEMARSF